MVYIYCITEIAMFKNIMQNICFSIAFAVKYELDISFFESPKHVMSSQPLVNTLLKSSEVWFTSQAGRATPELIGSTVNVTRVFVHG